MRPDEKQVGGSHYKDMAIQPWTIMQQVLTQEEFIGFLKGNIIKYSMRAGRKGAKQEDIDKARHYIEKLDEVKSDSWL